MDPEGRWGGELLERERKREREMSISEQMERLAALLAGPLYVRMKP